MTARNYRANSRREVVIREEPGNFRAARKKPENLTTRSGEEKRYRAGGVKICGVARGKRRDCSWPKNPVREIIRPLDDCAVIYYEGANGATEAAAH